MRLLILLGLAALMPTQAVAQSACYSNKDLVRGLRKRFGEAPYVRERPRLLRYQTWGGGRNFVTIVDDTGDFGSGDWFSEVAVEERLRNVLNKYYETQSKDAQFIVVFSSFQVPFPGAFYLPMANDTTGIGYSHSFFGGRETFDTTPDTPLDGLVVMNDYTIWGGLDDLSHVFNQEVGHRWSAFPFYRTEGSATNESTLLGRDDAHWSFFFNSGGSPMEGNWWREDGSNTFTTITTQSNLAYHSLDLYLMGLMPPEEVGPFWFIENPDTSDFGRLRASSAPATFRSYTLTGTKKELTVDDIIRAEGVRTPTYENSPKSFKVGFILMMQSGQQNDQTILDQFDSILDSLVAKWKTATGNRGTLEVVSAGPPPPQLRELGDFCEASFDCDSQSSTACLETKVNPSAGKFCSRRCDSSNLCPNTFCCIPGNLLGEPRYCFPESSGLCPTPIPDAGVPPAVPDAGTENPPPPGDGGGCSTAAGNTGWTLLPLLLAALFLATRRKWAGE